MADIANVETAFVNIIAAAIMPPGYTSLSVATSPQLNIPIRLMRGWPLDNILNADLRGGITNIAVFSAPNVAINKTMMLQTMAQTSVFQAPITMTAAKVGNVVTFAGTGSTAEVIGIGINPGGQGAGYATRLTAGQTPTQVATLFAANLPTASSVGAALTITSPFRVDVGADVTQNTEVHRQEQMIMVNVWAPTVAIRDAVCNYIDPALMITNRIIFPDRSASGPIKGAGTTVDDVVQKENAWRRTLFYNIMYPTMYTEVLPVMVLGKENYGSLTFID